MTRKINWVKIQNYILLFFFFSVVAAASYHGYFTKWTIRDDFNGIKIMLENEAPPPFIYRRLMIEIVQNTIKIIPQNIKENCEENYKSNNYIANQYKKANVLEKYILEYYLLYYLTYFFLLGTMFLMRETFINVTQNKLAGTGVAVVFTLLFPLFENGGGYWYDFGEIFFFALFLYFITSEKFEQSKTLYIFFPIFTILASYNKESFLFFIATLFPFFATKFGNKKACCLIVFYMFLAGITYLFVRYNYAPDNTKGSFIFYQLQYHIDRIFEGWGQTDIFYGVLFGRGTHWSYILLIFILIKLVWKKIPTVFKRHAYIALIITTPLYLLACTPGELRNFSLLYPAFWVLIAFYLKDNFLLNDKKVE